VFVRHVFRYFVGRDEMLEDGPALVEAHRAYAESGGSMRALLASILTSPAFLQRTSAGPDGETVGGKTVGSETVESVDSEP
jgi:hypothetical protein